MTQQEQQEKARFFALYWRQHILRSLLWADSIQSCKLYPDVVGNDEKYKFYLLLTPLSMITDTDRYEVAGILGLLNSDSFIDCLSKEDNIYKSGITRVVEAIDYLRSRGYALPYMGISVQQQIEKGWIKLKEVK